MPSIGTGPVQDTSLYDDLNKTQITESNRTRLLLIPES